MNSEYEEMATGSESGTPTYRAPRLASLGRTADRIRGNNPAGAQDAKGGFYGS